LLVIMVANERVMRMFLWVEAVGALSLVACLCVLEVRIVFFIFGQCLSVFGSITIFVALL